MFGKKKVMPEILLWKGNELIYQGMLRDIPLKESVILEKSVEFFDDPEPCHIHRSAVRVRLTAELEKECVSKEPETPGPLLTQYMDCEGIDRYMINR